MAAKLPSGPYLFNYMRRLQYPRWYIAKYRPADLLTIFPATWSSTDQNLEWAQFRLEFLMLQLPRWWQKTMMRVCTIAGWIGLAMDELLRSNCFSITAGGGHGVPRLTCPCGHGHRSWAAVQALGLPARPVLEWIELGPHEETAHTC